MSESQAGASSSRDGIDIRKALEILSSRSAEEHTHDENGCHHHAPKDSASMGQVIDLNQSSENDTKDADEGEQGDESTSIEERQKKLDEERAKRALQLKEELQSMTVKELLNAVMEAQEKRVAAFREFNRGLDSVLETGNMTNYTNVCAEATAAFSVLSETIKAIQIVLLESRNRPDLHKLVGDLQKHEKEKLNLVAALHLEKIRAQSQSVDVKEGDQRILALLREGVSSLESKIAELEGEINETLEEIRYAMMDEDD